MTCASCDLPTVGKSKYCSTHRAIARQAWKANVERSASERAERVESFARVWKEAREEAQRACESAQPTPMVVYETVGLSDIPKEGGKAWEVSEGLCGFAWLWFPKANTSFVRWLAKEGIGSKNYGGGWKVSSYELTLYRGQSVERKEASMSRASEVLRSAGISCYAESRLD
jgi:hypothetical protein